MNLEAVQSILQFTTRSEGAIIPLIKGPGRVIASLIIFSSFITVWIARRVVLDKITRRNFD